MVCEAVSQLFPGIPSSDPGSTIVIAPKHVGGEEAAERKARLSRMIADQLVPLLVKLHEGVTHDSDSALPSQSDIVELSHLVLGPNLNAAEAYVSSLRKRGLPMEILCDELLQPAAQYLGVMWERDECDFVDVTLGVAQLQQLLSVFTCTLSPPSSDDRRRVFLCRAPGEQHSFGLAVVDKLLRSAGWHVGLDTDLEPGSVIEGVAEDWYAVAGISLSSERHLDQVTDYIRRIRQESCNPGIAIMVGGPVFVSHPEMVDKVDADAMAISATTAVILAQKLFDQGASCNWGATPE